MPNKVKFYHIGTSSTQTNAKTYSSGDGKDGIVFSEKAGSKGIFVNGVKYGDDYDGTVSSINGNISSINTKLNNMFPSKDVSVYLSGNDLCVKVGGVESKMDAGSFIKDGFLSNVSYNESTHIMTFTWNTDSGKNPQSTPVNLSGLVDTVSVKESTTPATKVYAFNNLGTGNTISVQVLDASSVLYEGDKNLKTKVDEVSTGVDNVNTRINNMDLSNIVNAGQYINSLSQTDGKISYTVASLPAHPTLSFNNSGAVTAAGYLVTAASGHAITARSAYETDIKAKNSYDFGTPTETPTDATLDKLFSTIASQIKSIDAKDPISALDATAAADSGYALSSVIETNGKISKGSQVILPKALTSPSASGSTTSFIDSISYNATTGTFTVTKKNVSFPAQPTHPTIQLKDIDTPTLKVDPQTGTANANGQTLKFVYNVEGTNNHTIDTVDASAALIPVNPTVFGATTVYNVSTYLDQLRSQVNTLAGQATGVSSVSGGSNNSASILTYVSKTTGAVSISSANIGTRVLTGYTAGTTGNIAATDSINTAFSKLSSAVSSLSNRAVPVDSSATAGSGKALTSVQLNSNGTISLNTDAALPKSFSPTMATSSRSKTFVSNVGYNATTGNWTASISSAYGVTATPTADNTANVGSTLSVSEVNGNYQVALGTKTISSRTISGYTTPSGGTIANNDTINAAFNKLDSSVADLAAGAYWYEV